MMPAWFRSKLIAVCGKARHTDPFRAGPCALRSSGTAILLLSALWLQPFAHAQGQGVVEGRVLNGTDPAQVPAKLQLEVIRLGGGMSVLTSATTDAAGKFRIAGVPVDAPLLIRAAYRSINYYGQANFDAAGKAQAEILVYEPTADMQGVRLESVQIAFKLGSEGLRSLESYTFRNETKPPRSLAREDGNFRFSKAPGILEPPRIDVTGPGSSMPVTQAPLESADGQSYYSLYPLRPGSTTFDVSQALPYANQQYSYRRVFYQDTPAFNIGVSPQGMTVTGAGLTKVQTDTARNFAVYSTGPVKAGAEVVWSFSGGTPVVETPASAPAAEPATGFRVQSMPTPIVRNALLLGPLMLIGFIVVLWYAQNHGAAASGPGQDTRIQELRKRREQLLDFVAALDVRYESQALDRREYLRLREQGKRHLRRITMLMAKK
jgi:hypothetical protein